MKSFEEVWSNRRRSVECLARLILRRSGQWDMFDDLVAAGMAGLFDAWRNYDPAKLQVMDFWRAYAVHRVRGAMYDELRTMDHVKRDGRQAIAAGGEEAVPAWCLVRKMRVDDLEEIACEGSIESQMLDRESRDLLWEAVGRLPGRLRDVVTWYYREDNTLKSIGRRLGLTESRVCQIKNEAIGALRASLCRCEECGDLHSTSDESACGRGSRAV
ncbi:MAG TPA: sigma-70 family RNA polymerase sigma factor [Conexivisphaerales archaeon]|nr:sigma-70 family RNA polymerase sigma factor [Conexivisphaerales archaeon]